MKPIIVRIYINSVGEAHIRAQISRKENYIMHVRNRESSIECTVVHIVRAQWNEDTSETIDFATENISISDAKSCTTDAPSSPRNPEDHDRAFQLKFAPTRQIFTILRSISDWPTLTPPVHHSTPTRSPVYTLFAFLLSSRPRRIALKIDFSSRRTKIERGNENEKGVKKKKKNKKNPLRLCSDEKKRRGNYWSARALQITSPETPPPENWFPVEISLWPGEYLNSEF